MPTPTQRNDVSEQKPGVVRRPLNVPLKSARTTAKDVPASPARVPAASRAEALPDDLVEVGYVSAAYGVRGWIKVQPHANDAAALLHATRWWLIKPPAPGVAGAGSTDPLCLQIADSREHSGTVVAQASGVADRSVAEALRGHRIWIRREDFPAPADDEFYWVDLIGCAVSNEQGESLGEVTGLLDNGAHQILQIAYPLADGNTGERLVPFVDAFLRNVDVPGKRIVVDWGLDF